MDDQHSIGNITRLVLKGEEKMKFIYHLLMFGKGSIDQNFFNNKTMVTEVIYFYHLPLYAPFLMLYLCVPALMIFIVVIHEQSKIVFYNLKLETRVCRQRQEVW